MKEKEQKELERQYGKKKAKEVAQQKFDVGFFFKELYVVKKIKYFSSSN